ncbi:MAG TPA: TIGR03667 family PPOX class F420-dependent oxidoreductase [Streptosporangiaceae bacterium]
MTSDVIPDQSSAFGERVRRRLTEEQVVWLTTVGRDGTPQPNPVWFLWDGDDGILIYTLSTAKRLSHIQRNPQVCLHFNSNARGGDVIILTGTAEILDQPSVVANSEYREKYDEGIERVSGSAEAFAAEYSVPVRVRVTHTRGF